jgi:hypothetical protein
VRLALLLGLFLAACASRPTNPPERGIFGLEVASVADGATAVPFRPDAAAAEDTLRADAASAPTGEAAGARTAFQTSLRIVRSDGTTLTAPRLTAFAGQRANIEILTETAYVMDFDVDYDTSPNVVDPVIGTLREGASIELLVLPAADGEAALALRVETSSARRPIATRELALGGPASVTIQTPHVETVEVVGAQRVRLGEETEWARLPVQEDDRDLVVLGRVDAVAAEFDGEAASPEWFDGLSGSASAAHSSRPSDGAGAADGAAPERAAERRPGRRTAPRIAPRPADLRALAAAAAQGAPCGELRVTAVRSGGESGSTVRTEKLGALSLRTVLAHGVGMSDLLREPYVADFDSFIGYAARFPLDPVIDTATSGLAATIGGDGALTLQWTTLPSFATFQTTLAQGPPLRIELPDGATSVRRVALSPGAAVHPMFTLRRGGSAVLVVEWEPDAGR